ncbi:MAG: tripartite tricarboxylate transporter permease [Firmicutes bacterium]|nr:tripartite tricarboxylate transporter permease [Bacillota bacterium]MCL5039631.1 tripartite tricarboxylate transporter permease [Bacillota bacterium]
MEVLNNLLTGFGVALTWQGLLYTLIGVTVGTLVGVLPGLGPSATLALLLPVTFGLDPTFAIAMLAGIYYGAEYGGSTTSILLNLPGEAGSVVTCLDGNLMAKKGRAGAALGIAAFGSFIAGTIGLIAFTFMAHPLAKWSLSFGPPEYSMLMMLGLVAAASLSRDKVKGLVMAILGLLLGTIGTDTVSGSERFTFGIANLMSGLSFIPVIMGLFAVGDIINNFTETSETGASVTGVSYRLRDLLPTREDWSYSIWPIIRGTVVGFLLGTLPGSGAAVAAFLAYSVERAVGRRRQLLGTGIIEGVAAPESANNAVTAGAMIPLFSFGIPGTPTTAILAGALMMYGLQPGPFLFVNHASFIWAVIATMYIGNVMLLVLNLPLIGLWVQLLKVPFYLLAPVVLVITVIGAFSVNNNIFDVWILLIFGFLGYLAKKNKYPVAPLVLGMIISKKLEQSLRRSLLMSLGDLRIFVSSPISLALSILVAVALLATIFSFFKSKKGVRTQGA